jgi:transposase
MPHSTVTIELTPEEREALAAIMRARRGRADLAKRARIIVRLADGASYADLIRLGESSRTIAKWKQRFLEGRVAGLAGRYRGNTPTVLTPALEARILAWTRKPPANGARSGARGRWRRR